jgi:phosphoglycerate dehydrogenase-like enzyme
VQVSRGAVVDTDALVARLQQGDITAGLDVFDPEPIPADHPITRLPNVFLSPHSASRTNGGGRMMFSLMVDEVQRVFSGHVAQFQLTAAAVANRHGRPPVATSKL